MGIINEAKSGSDITHPRLSVGWMVGAVIGIFLLAIAAAIAMYGYGKAKALTGMGQKSGNSDASITDQTSSVAGWL